MFHLLIVFFAVLLASPFVHSQSQVPQTNLETLKLAQVIFRHGDRTPEYAYPNDPFSNASIYWPEGWGQLTKLGKQQEFQLGRYLRQRYGNYVSDSFIPDQLYAISSDTDRTIMSGLLVLAGMFPVNNETTWDDSVNWQPFPIRTIFTEQDNLIRFKRKCPKFQALLDDLLVNSPVISKLNEENKELYANLSRLSGVNIKTINDIDNFYASMSVEELKGLDIPEWGKPLKEDQHFQYLYNFSFLTNTFNDDLKRLRSGNLVKYLVNNINERIRNATSKTKMFAISGHDRTLVDIMNTFGVWDLQRPEYSSVLMIELHQEESSNSEESYSIQMYFGNSTSRGPYKLSIPGCGSDCSLTTFLNLTKPLIPEDWESECQRSQPFPAEDGNSTMFIYILIGLGALALVVFIIGLACMLLKKNKRNISPTYRNDYQTFQN